MRTLDGVTLRGRFGLTERQAEFADLVIRGLSNEEIARRVGVTHVGSVKNRLKKVFDAVGVNNRTELLIVAAFGRENIEVNLTRKATR